MSKRPNSVQEHNQDVLEFGAGSGSLVCGTTEFPAVLSKMLSAALKLAAAAAALAALVYMAATLYCGFAPLSIKARSARINIKLYNHKGEPTSYHMVLFDRHDPITRVTRGENGEGVHFAGKQRGKDYDRLQVAEGRITNTRQTLGFDGLSPDTAYEVLIVADEGKDTLKIVGRFVFETPKEDKEDKKLPDAPVPEAPPAEEDPKKPLPSKPTVPPYDPPAEETKPEEPTLPPYTPPYTPPSDSSSVTVAGELVIRDISDPIELDDGTMYGYFIDLTFTASGGSVTPVQIELLGNHYWFMGGTEPWYVSELTVDASGITGTQTMKATVEIDPEYGLTESGRDEWTAVLTYVDSNGQTGTATASGSINAQAYATLTMKSAIMTRLYSYNTGDGMPMDSCQLAIEAEAEVIPGFDGAPELTVNGLVLSLPYDSTSISSVLTTYTVPDDLTVTRIPGTNRYTMSGVSPFLLYRNAVDDDPNIHTPYLESSMGWIFGTDHPLTIQFGPGYDPDENQNGLEDDDDNPPGWTDPPPEPEPEPDYSEDSVILPSMPDNVILLDIVQSGVTVDRLEMVSPGELVQIRIQYTASTDAANGEEVTLTPPSMTSGKVVVTQPAPSQVTANGGQASDTFWYSFYMPADMQIDDLIMTPAS